jgi:tetratricopeptide (TPR) repeat protein
VSLLGAELEEAQKLFRKGDYAECLSATEKGLAENPRSEEWPLLRVQTLMTVGRYTEARDALDAALKRDRRSIRLRLLGYDVFRQNGEPEKAAGLLQEINELGGTRMWAYQDPPNLIALGRAALLLGADPRRVLENFFDQVKKTAPRLRDVYLASGELALSKGDLELAAKTFDEGLQQCADDPDLLYGLARAYLPSDRPEMGNALEAALEQNPHHVPSHLLLAEHLIDGEQYEPADKALAEALEVNPWHAEAWTFRAIIAHLRGEATAQGEALEKARKFWAGNPVVPHLFGKKLAQKYRFAESAAEQRKALGFEKNFLPAKIQLAQDLLRLGDEEEGWTLAEQVHKADGYDVTAYNLVTLRERLAKFQSLTNDDFLVRMSAQEAEIYGARVMALLQRAKETLSAKYGHTPERPTIVEIFPEQKDFAVRTFGMPGNPGFLGVCFGRVITANSPASQGASPENWEAVLWHEFCHVITLQMTRNKMPRWLSEGISVYEERLANPAWGQRMHSKYREMVVGDDFVPIRKLSAAFLSPKSDEHVQFAYFESSLVVEFLVEKFGFESLKKILVDLGEGKLIEQAIAAHTAPLDQVEKDFAAFARARAESLAPKLDWTEPPGRAAARAAAQSRRAGGPAPRRRASLLEGGEFDEAWRALHPNNFYVMTREAKRLVSEKKWPEAKTALLQLIELYPDQTSPDNAYEMLAAVHRALKETDEERAVLARIAEREADAIETYARLMELESARTNWTAVLQNAERYLAVNPLLPVPYRWLAQAAEALNEKPKAIDAYRRLLLLDPPNPAEAHFRLAKLLHDTADPAAKRHVLIALEEAPRYREAHRLLLDIAGRGTSPASAKEKPPSSEQKQAEVAAPAPTEKKP